MHQFVQALSGRPRRLSEGGEVRTEPPAGASGQPGLYGDVPGAPGLAGWAKVFFGRPGPRVLAGALAIVAARRARLGGWRAQDLLVAGTVVSLHPFAEWAVHVYILHGPSRRARRAAAAFAGGRASAVLGEPAGDGRAALGLGGFGAREGFSARKHREHHENPQDIDLVLLPKGTVAGLAAAAALPAWVAPDRRRGATGAATSLLMLLAYEWIHFLIHSPYRPRGAVYRARWRAHRLHHYRNENYWFGVVGTVADRVLGTAPAKGDVPMSGTARSLAVPAATPAATKVGAGAASR
jgi:hypothetical protein